MRRRYLLRFTLVLFVAVNLSAASFSLSAQSGTSPAEKPQDKQVEALQGEPAIQAIPAAEIQIPFPQRDLHVRSVDPKAGHVKAELGPGEENRSEKQAKKGEPDEDDS
ncbi:MAG: hypothetical protein WBB73_01645 [Candidatus Aminicenantaceae bacterium]